MRSKNIVIVSVLCVLSVGAQETENKDGSTVKSAFEPTWESLTKHEVPEWFQDAKFGIYAHLGVYCVPAYGTEWYPRMMYMKSDDPSSVFQHHKTTYGDQSVFGYKDLIPMFKLEKFDPAAWADLYYKSGAKFAGPVAEHHDGFSMWASQVNRWNAKDMGPKRDVVGELVKEIRKHDMKVITTFHHGWNFDGYYASVPGFDTTDSKYADLYGKLPEDVQLERWLAKLKEVIDAYQPDQIWFDSDLGKIDEKYRQQFASYYYNKEAEWGKQVIIARKGNDLPEGVGVLDIERGRMQNGSTSVWQTDDSTAYNSWSGVRDLQVKPAKEVLHEFIDIVSKNGVLLLNVCPMADGTIDKDQQKILLEMGKWLEINGEAIYATRQWNVFGEGPTQIRGGAFQKTVQYSSKDIRFTQSKDGKNVFIISLGEVVEPLLVKALGIKAGNIDKAIDRIEVLGSDEVVKWQQTDDALRLEPLANSVCEEATVFKLTFAKGLIGFGTDIDPEKQIIQSQILAKQLAKPDSPTWRAGGDQKRHYWFPDAGADVAFRVCVPSTWDGKSKLPLVMFLHGGWNDESSYLDANNKQLVKLADEHGYLLVSPLGYKGAYGNSLLLPAQFGRPLDSEKVLAQRTPEKDKAQELSEKDVINVLEIVLNEYPVERSRMFLAGHSMGSGGTWYIGAKYNHYWAALAPMSGPFVQETTYPWERIRKMPVFISEGTRAPASLEGSRQMYKWMNENGFSVEYKEVDADHPGMVPLVLPDVFSYFDRF